MTVLSIPASLRLASSALLLSIPLIALEIIIVARAPWWKMPLRNMGYWSLAFALICIPLVVWLIGAKRWAFSIATGFAAAWIIASALLSIRMKYPGLGFFTIFLLGYFFLVLPWLKYELERSFFNPQLAWYQGLPKPIPGLKCRVTVGEKSVDLKVSRFDLDGVFVFSPTVDEKEVALFRSLVERKKLELGFDFRDRQFVCEGAPVVAIEKGVGAGIQFHGISPDQRKEIGDFVEVLRGEGYV